MARILPDEIDDLLELTRDPEPKLRSEAVRALCPCHVKANHERIWERFFEMVKDEDMNVRRSVFHALGDGSPKALESRAVAAVEEMQRDPNPRLQRRARKLIAHYRRTGQINIL